jgi:hypothetical protein
MNITILNNVRAAICWLLLFPFVLNGQSISPNKAISKTYKCGAQNSSKFKLAADGDFIFYLQDERHSKTHLYRINTSCGFIDSFSFKFPDSNDLIFHALTAMDVTNDTLVICYGNHINIYYLTKEGKCRYLKNIIISSEEVIFSASLYQGNLYLSCDMPNVVQKHIFRTINCNTGKEFYNVEHLTHLATLTTFKPSNYFASLKDTIFYYDVENFQILTVYNNQIDTLVNVKFFFDSKIDNFIKSTAKIKGLKELDYYIMNGFGKFKFDFIHEIYISNSKIYLFYFPANHNSTSAKLERQLCVIEREAGNKTHYVITKTAEYNLLDFQSVIVRDELYIVSNNDNSIYIQEYSKLVRKN